MDIINIVSWWKFFSILFVGYAGFAHKSYQHNDQLPKKKEDDELASCNEETLKRWESEIHDKKLYQLGMSMRPLKFLQNSNYHQTNLLPFYLHILIWTMWALYEWHVNAGCGLFKHPNSLPPLENLTPFSLFLPLISFLLSFYLRVHLR